MTDEPLYPNVSHIVGGAVHFNASGPIDFTITPDEGCPATISGNIIDENYASDNFVLDIELVNADSLYVELVDSEHTQDINTNEVYFNNDSSVTSLTINSNSSIKISGEWQWRTLSNAVGPVLRFTNTATNHSTDYQLIFNEWAIL